MKKMCAKCGGSVKKMAKGGSMKTTVGSKSAKSFIAGIPNSGPTGPNYQGVDTMKKGGIAKAKFGATVAVKASCKKGMVRGADGKCVMERPKFAKGGSSFGMLSVKAGIDKNPKPTAADRIAGATRKMKSGGMMKAKKK
jgi:hypothetical protein